MRGRFLLLAPVVLAAVACGDYDDGHWYSDNEIVFGIRQKVSAVGATEVVAGYEYLGLANKGGWVTNVFRDGDGDGTCYFERFDNRLGQPRVESGVATWTGGNLPRSGLTILANQPEPTRLQGEGWQATDELTFDVTGFAMPKIRAVTMNAPRVELGPTTIAPALAEGATELSLNAADDVGVTWPAVDAPARVMVSLETEETNGPGGEVRCFGTPRSGSAVIPAKWVARLFSSVDPGAPIKGRLEIASHRQVTYHTRGSWTVYVVATTVHREQTFVGVR